MGEEYAGVKLFYREIMGSVEIFHEPSILS